MADTSSATLNRILGVAWLIVGLGALLVALAREPIGDWGTWNLLMGAVLAFLAVVGLYVAVTGKGTLTSTGREGVKPRSRRILALVAIVAIGLVIVLQLAGGTLTTSDILSVGIWLGLLGSMIAILIETNAQITRQVDS
jgi:lysylphosphatidylglycerol synthetase-like protein (DUF2156 family)